MFPGQGRQPGNGRCHPVERMVRFWDGPGQEQGPEGQWGDGLYPVRQDRVKMVAAGKGKATIEHPDHVESTSRKAD